MNFFKKKISSLLSDDLSKNIMIVSSGAAVAQAIKVLSQPMITRVFSPEEYGLLSLFNSLILILNFCTLKYEAAIPISENDDEAKNLISLSYIFLIISSLLLIILFILFGEELLNLLNAKELYSYRFFLPVGLLSFTGATILIQWMYRKKNYQVVTINKVSQSLFTSVLKILFGILNFSGVGLIIGQISGEIMGAVPLYSEFYKTKNKEKKYNFSFKSVIDTARKYKNFPLYLAPSSLAIHGRAQLPIIFLSSIYGASTAGFYGLANSIIKLPMTIIGQSVMQVFYSEIASIGKKNPMKIKKISRKLLKQLGLISIPPMLILLLIAPAFFSLIFGQEWNQAGIFTQILTIYVLPDFILSPISRVFEVFNKQNIKMIIDITSLILLAGLFIVTSFIKPDIYITLILYAIIMLVVTLMTYYLSMKIVNDEINKNS